MFDLSQLLTYWNVLLIACVWAGIQYARKLFPRLLGPDGVYARFLPLLPEIVCVAFMWVPGPWLAPGTMWGQRVILGLVLGMCTSKFHVVTSKLGLQDFVGVEVDPDKRTTPPTPPSLSLVVPDESTKPNAAAPGAKA